MIVKYVTFGNNKDIKLNLTNLTAYNQATAVAIPNYSYFFCIVPGGVGEARLFNLFFMYNSSADELYLSATIYN